MNQTVKEKWIAALTSGEYKQGRQSLKSGDKFCCLGVLCDLYVKEGLAGEWSNDVFYTNGFQNTVDLPSAVIEWAGLEGRTSEVEFDYTEDTLAGLNDSGSSFERIARVIEKNL